MPADRAVASSIDELLASATARRPMSATDSKSGARFESVLIDGRPHIVKYLHVDDDWIMRASGDLACRPLQVWQSGLLDQLPPTIDHTVVGAAAGLGRNGWGAALLMRDVSPWLVPAGDAPVPMEQELGFLSAMACLHAAFWGWTDTVGLAPIEHRVLEFSPQAIAGEAERGWPDAVPPLIVEGWQRFAQLPGPVPAAVMDLLREPSPLVDALGGLPRTFLHGDWKMGNLGTLPDGRTILLDWALPGAGCPTLELAWYLSLNSARLPHPKEEAIAAYRDALGGHGIATGDWWGQALDLALLAGVVWFGWEKALGGPGPELDWWLTGAEAGLQWL